MPQENFQRFMKDIGCNEEVANKLWEGNIRSPQALASTKSSVVSDLVDSPVLINTLLPKLQKYAFPIAMAKDPYKHALFLLQRDSQTGSDNEPNNTTVESDTTPYTASVGVGNSAMNTSHPSRDNSNSSMGEEDEENERFYTLGENGLEDRTASYNRGFYGDVSHTVQTGNTTSIKIMGGNFVQPNIGNQPAVYNNINATIIANSINLDSTEAREKRRSEKLPSSFLKINGKIITTSNFQFQSNPSYWANDAEVHRTSDKVYEARNKDDNVYPMKTWNSGRALIINNFKFSDSRLDRDGADIDSKRLEVTLKQVGFEVLLKENKKANEIRQLLREFSSSNRNKDGCSVSFVFIGSHGERDDHQDYFIGVDSQKIPVTDVIANFTASKCPDLSGKPKLFCFQFCRSDRKKAPISKSNPEDNRAFGTDMFPSQTNDDATVENGSSASTVDPRNEAHMLWSFATAAGTKAYRDTKDGSWFVTAFCKILKENAKSEDLVSMITMVNKSVMAKNERDERSNENAVQMTEFKSTLDRKVRFYPR